MVVYKLCIGSGLFEVRKADQYNASGFKDIQVFVVGSDNDCKMTTE